MATWTQSDADKLRAAILALATGEAVQTIRYDGPPSRTVTYQPTDLGKMRELLAAIEKDVARTAGTGRTVRYMQTGKGF